MCRSLFHAAPTTDEALQAHAQDRRERRRRTRALLREVCDGYVTLDAATATEPAVPLREAVTPLVTEGRP